MSSELKTPISEFPNIQNSPFKISPEVVDQSQTPNNTYEPVRIQSAASSQLAQPRPRVFKLQTILNQDHMDSMSPDSNLPSIKGKIIAVRKGAPAATNMSMSKNTEKTVQLPKLNHVAVVSTMSIKEPDERLVRPNNNTNQQTEGEYIAEIKAEFQKKEMACMEVISSLQDQIQELRSRLDSQNNLQ